MTRWRHATRDEMGGYDFEMYEKSVGSRWAHINYDFGHWTHPRYPPGYYWSGGDRTPDSKTVYGGPFNTLQAAKDDADAWLTGKAIPVSV